MINISIKIYFTPMWTLSLSRKWSQGLEFEVQDIFHVQEFVWIFLYRMSVHVILYCSDLFRGRKKNGSLDLNLQSSTASGACIVVKGYRLIKFFHIEIIGKYERNHSLR